VAFARFPKFPRFTRFGGGLAVALDRLRGLLDASADGVRRDADDLRHGDRQPGVGGADLENNPRKDLP
jgi:hypothetical protein